MFLMVVFNTEKPSSSDSNASSSKYMYSDLLQHGMAHSVWNEELVEMNLVHGSRSHVILSLYRFEMSS